MRTKIVINHPFGHPYILYQVTDKKTRRLVASASELRAKQDVNMSNGKAKPVRVIDLIKELGHTKTSNLLAEINPRWICKDGKVFYKNV